MNTLTTGIGQVPEPTAYAILAASVLAESVLLIGAFVPTLTLLLTAGALARTGELDLVLVIATASCAVMVGDALGHRTGHLLGSRLRTGRIGRRTGGVPRPSWHDVAGRRSSSPGSYPSYAPWPRTWQVPPGRPTAA
ncbi:hypothetical protein [Streptomyces sp. BK79]|uniref:hypothetical protein n=1 Tax=Streptomyces sp. BK79 TaxID=3350097 RepID=UPI00376FB551